MKRTCIAEIYKTIITIIFFRKLNFYSSALWLINIWSTSHLFDLLIVIYLFFVGQMEEMRKEVEAMQLSSQDYSSKLATLTRQLEDRDNKLRRMQMERQKHLEEVYEMK